MLTKNRLDPGYLKGVIVDQQALLVKSLSLLLIRFMSRLLELQSQLLLHFTAAWSGACKYCKPFFAELAHEEDWVFAEVDVDKEPSLMAKFNVQSFPTFMVFKGGVQWGMFKGARVKESLRSEFKRIVESELPEGLQEADGVQRLITAVAQHNVADIRKLIERGVNVNDIVEASSMMTFSPLTMAIIAGTEEIIDILVDAHVRVDKNFNDSMMKKLEDHDTNGRMITECLQYAKQRSKDVPAYLKNTKEIIPNFLEQFLPVQQDPVELKKLLDLGNVDTVFTNFDKREGTALMVAILYNNTGAVDLLIDAGASLATEILDEQGQKQSVEQRIMGEIERRRLFAAEVRERYSYLLKRVGPLV